MSCPQHIGDLTFPCPSGHSEMCTVLPSSSFRELCFNSLPHVPHVIVPMLIPHFSQVYAAIVFSPVVNSQWDPSIMIDNRAQEKV